MGRTDLDESLSIREGRLFIEECDAAELTLRHGSPLYVVSEDQLRRNVRRITGAFASRWPEGRVNVLPSIKASFTMALRHILTDEGTGCDAFGGGEMDAALRSGVPPWLISLNGPKDQATIDRAVQAKVKITLDHVDELAMVGRAVASTGWPATIRPRIRPDLESLDQPSDWLDEPVPVKVAAQIYKAGIPAEDVLAMGKEALSMDGVTVSGVHVHVGRHRTEPDYWRQVVTEVVEFLAELRDAWGRMGARRDRPRRRLADSS